MICIALAPSLIILFGIYLGQAGVRPTMLAWAVYVLGALGGLGVTIGIFVHELPQPWIFALIAGFPSAFVISMSIKDLTFPFINDVTTDVENPLSFVTALKAPSNAGRDMAFPKHCGPIILKEYPMVRPLLLDDLPDQIFRRVSALIDEKRNWKVMNRDENKGVIELEVTTVVFGFVDDVVIRVVGQSGGARVDMRSKSREGLIDGGYNAKRILAFFEQLSRTSTRK